jgi:energy-coupling factor transporter ATP-binding protein EcfA2
VVERTAVRSSGVDAPIAALSGGNQRRSSSAVLRTEPKVILLDEPTRGVDIGAKDELGRLIGDLADAGAAVLLASSELRRSSPSATGFLVMRAGRVVADIRGGARDRARHPRARARHTGVWPLPDPPLSLRRHAPAPAASELRGRPPRRRGERRAARLVSSPPPCSS